MPQKRRRSGPHDIAIPLVDGLPVLIQLFARPSTQSSCRVKFGFFPADPKIRRDLEGRLFDSCRFELN